MRLNYQNSSNCGINSAFSWYQQLHVNLSNFKVNIYLQDYSYAKTLLIAFRKHYKRVSSLIKIRVTHATGEVFGINEDGRGFVVPAYHAGKGPKHFICSSKGQIRSYTTRSRTNRLEPVQDQPVSKPKGLQILAKH